MTTETYDEPGTLMATTIGLIKRDNRSLPELYRDTGIPYFWLKKFVAGEVRNPSVNRVQFLYETLTTDKLTLDPNTKQ